jgi:hypothetical protein
MHQGAMADEVPGDMQIPGGIDIPTYFGKLTNAVKALSERLNGYDRLLGQTQGGM